MPRGFMMFNHILLELLIQRSIQCPVCIDALTPFLTYDAKCSQLLWTRLYGLFISYPSSSPLQIFTNLVRTETVNCFLYILLLTTKKIKI